MWIIWIIYGRRQKNLELLKKEDERKNKNNMIQSGSEIYENSLQNTINQ